jgi:hypothetical protein
MANYSTSTRDIRIADDELKVVERSNPSNEIDVYDLNADNVKLSQGAGDTFDVIGVGDEGPDAITDVDQDGNEVKLTTANVLDIPPNHSQALSNADVYVRLDSGTLYFTKDDI